MNTTQPPQNFPRRILLAVTGLSPQIVTETLYALAQTQPAFIPTEIHVLTTLEGARLAKAALLHPDGGQFHALLTDYPHIGHPAFDEANIHLITNQNGQPLSDIRTPDENAAAADTITALVAELTTDNEAALHVSIAGGRKTMGFYLGYAFSLFARPQDRLSHVLVSPPFESHPEFFYPPATPKRLATRDGRHIDTAEATVTLAEIPVVRLRHGMPQALQEGRTSFIATVTALQSAFAPPRLEINLSERRVHCGGQELKLKPSLIAWLGYWAHSVLEARPMQSWRDADANTFLRLYARVVNPDSEIFEATQKRLINGLEKEFFQENNSKLDAEIKKALGQAAAPYLLARDGKKPNTRRGLALPPEAIILRL
ncbi:MAG: CRISPR-associated ring nuclease Csm6 [Rhodocyclaceae bacterium]|nr:CRISPR-associated ring nuclease Csm6 [Rhodocyclaceae bacterium]